MSSGWHLLKPNHYLSTQARLIKEWQNQDVVAFSQLIDFTRIVDARLLRATKGRRKPTYTACVLDAIAKTLRDHPKMNRIVYHTLTGYHWAQFENIDIAVGVEAIDGDTDIAFATIIRNADGFGADVLSERLHRVSAAPSDDPQLNRLRRLPPSITGAVARGTGLHPKLWVRFRGGSCALTSPAKYGVENVLVKSAWPVQFAFGNVKQRAMVVDGECVPRHSAMLSMSWHRELTTGAVAARFFEDVVQRLQSGIADPAEQPPQVIPRQAAQWRTADK